MDRNSEAQRETAQHIVTQESEVWEERGLGNPKGRAGVPRGLCHPWYGAQRGAGTDLRSHSKAGEALHSQAPPTFYSDYPIHPP